MWLTIILWFVLALFFAGIWSINSLVKKVKGLLIELSETKRDLEGHRIRNCELLSENYRSHQEGQKKIVESQKEVDRLRNYIEELKKKKSVYYLTRLKNYTDALEKVIQENGWELPLG